MIRAILLLVSLALILYGFISYGSSLGWFVAPRFSDEIILFLALSHAGLFVFIVRQLGHRPEDFVKIYLGSTVLRILFFGAFIFFIIRLDREGRTANALFFLVSYFLFTGLEVALLYPVVRNQKPSKTGQKGL